MKKINGKMKKEEVCRKDGKTPSRVSGRCCRLSALLLFFVFVTSDGQMFLGGLPG